MYCVNCGVKLADSEKVCPLCNTSVYHPDIKRPEAIPLFPQKGNAPEKVNPTGLLFVLSFIFIQPILITLFCDLQLNMKITWSAYSVGGTLLAYIMLILPGWFRSPNPVIFVPIDFLASGLMLAYINYATDSNWFMTFAFPILGYLAVIVCTDITLCKYLRRGYLYIFGGTMIALAGMFVMIELLVGLTFAEKMRIFWSPYPAVVCLLFGLMLIIIAIVKPFRESICRIFAI